MDARAIERFGESSGVRVRWPSDYVFEGHRWDRRALLETRTADFDVRTNPCVDFGRYVERIPRCVLEPSTSRELAESVAFLSKARIPFALRGGGHSSGGQTLSTGVVLALGRLSYVEDRGSTVVAGGGTPWLDVMERLLPERRPVVLTDNLRATVGGTLSVGGFGDTSHRYGLQVDSVVELELVTPDGAIHQADRSSDLFRFALAGRGFLGAIASATLEVIERPTNLSAKLATFSDLGSFARSAPHLERLEWIRARWFRPIVEAVVAMFGDPIDLELPEGELSRAWESVDLLPILRRDPIETWRSATPAAEVTLPLETGTETALRMHDHLERRGIARFLENGVSVSVVPRSPLPLAPTHGGPSLHVAFRPKMSPNEARQHLEALQEIGTMALDANGRLYLMSVEPERFDLRAQWGAAHDRLRALVARHAPGRAT